MTEHRFPVAPHSCAAAQLTALVFAGLLAAGCAALAPTAGPRHQFVEGRADLIEADAYVYNATGAPVSVRVRTLGDHTRLECSSLREAPQEALRSDMFTGDSAWRLAPGENAALWPSSQRTQLARGRGCYAAMLVVDGSDPVFVVWDELSLPPRGVPVAPEGIDALLPGAVTIERSGEAVALCGKGNVAVMRVPGT